MIYKPYGKTGKQVSAIGFGGMHFDASCSIEEGAEIVRYASELGINYFDTAPGYCQDRSEAIFGEAFKAMPYPYYVSTKSMISADPTEDDVRRRIECSPIYMEIYNSYSLKGMEAAKVKYAGDKAWNRVAGNLPTAKACIACRKCEKLCTQKLDIIKRLEWIDTHIEQE